MDPYLNRLANYERSAVAEAILLIDSGTVHLGPGALCRDGGREGAILKAVEWYIRMY